MAVNDEKPAKHKRSLSYSGSIFASILPSPSSSVSKLERELANIEQEENEKKKDKDSSLSTKLGGKMEISNSSASLTAHTKVTLTHSLHLPKIHHVLPRSLPQAAVATVINEPIRVMAGVTDPTDGRVSPRGMPPPSPYSKHNHQKGLSVCWSANH